MKADDDFRATLRKKVEQEIAWLEFKGLLRISGLQHQSFIYDIANYCDTYVQKELEKVRPVLEKLSKKYRLVVACNYYGNLQTVLRTYNLDKYFSAVVDSNAVGVRKPDPAFFEHAFKAAECEKKELVVVGDNFQKDIVTPHDLGCRTIWFKGETWNENDETLANAIITALPQILELL